MALRELLNTQAGNARKGRRYATVTRNGQTVHDYAKGPDVAVGPAQAAEATGGHGQSSAAPYKAAGTLAGLIAGSRAFEDGGGKAGPVLASHAHDGTAEGASIGTNAAGEKFSQVQVGHRKFHVYFTPQGGRRVREIKAPAPTFTPG